MKHLNYKQAIKNEYNVAKLNALNFPFNAQVINRFLKIAKFMRRVNKRHIGCSSLTAKWIYDEMRQADN